MHDYLCFGKAVCQSCAEDDSRRKCMILVFSCNYDGIDSGVHTKFRILPQSLKMAPLSCGR